jgi:hypothetical protein
MRNSLRANITKAVYAVWMDQGQHQIVAAQDVLERYRQEIGDTSAAQLEEELYFMVDDPGPIPFLRVGTKDSGGELGYLGLTDINPDGLLTLMSGAGHNS